MREYVKLSITFYKEKAGRRKIEKEKELREKLKPYIVGDGGLVLGFYYKLDTANEIYSQVLKFSRNKRCVDLHIEYINEYTTAELERAKCFLLRPKKTYVQNKEVFEYLCENCSCRELAKQKEIIFKNLQINREIDVFKIGEGINELNCISEKVYNLLIKNGVDANEFVPIILKDNSSAYALNPIATCDVKSDVYKYTRCKKCGCIYARFNKKKRNSHEHIVVDSAIDFSEYDIYKTLQYYDGEQKIILSPKLYRLIKQFIKVQEITPIF